MDSKLENETGWCKSKTQKQEQPEWLLKVQETPPEHRGYMGWFYKMEDGRYARIESRGYHDLYWSVVSRSEYLRLSGIDIRREDMDYKYGPEGTGYDECAHDIEDMVGQDD